MSTLFISDLHLDVQRPDITAALLRLLEGEAREAEALYILGDLFEAWVGDDDPGEPGATVAAALRSLSDSGVPVFLLRGNRDFLLGQAFAERANANLLPDPCVIDLYGEATLLMHGDLLCTGDSAYQAFRRQVRDHDWQEKFLAQPLAARQAFAAQARAASRAHQAGLADAGAMDSIADVTPDAVIETMARFGVRRLIHGHTHRPAIHALEVDGRAATRVVLGDWHAQGSILRVDRDGLALSSLPLTC
ncbi:MAG TPA: UDP-2,3-diacylglucosamine diphosphatase [Arenimonas sp.]|nr:UDP-2,3-diacylglucosamine diphosphatase [Arenimonas sp.]